jgi:hypothetical protein
LSRNGSLWLSYRRSGRVYIAWSKDVEKLWNDDLRNGLLGLREAMTQVVDITMKERTSIGVHDTGRARETSANVEQLFRTALSRTEPTEATKVKLFMVMHLNT